MTLIDFAADPQLLRRLAFCDEMSPRGKLHLSPALSCRESGLAELSKRRESFPELAPYLWHSFGTVAALLQEILAVYPYLSPPTLTAHASNRVCNALALLQCVASHPETRGLFLAGGPVALVLCFWPSALRDQTLTVLHAQLMCPSSYTPSSTQRAKHDLLSISGSPALESSAPLSRCAVQQLRIGRD